MSSLLVYTEKAATHATKRINISFTHSQDLGCFGFRGGGGGEFAMTVMATQE